MNLIEICSNCKLCGEGLTPLPGLPNRLIGGDLEARTLVIMEWRENWQEVADRLLGTTPYAIAFAVRCSPADDLVNQRIFCSIYNRQLMWGFDAFVIEGSAGNDIFLGITKEHGVTNTHYGPVVFIESFTSISKADVARYAACISSMQSVKTGRVLRKGVTQ